MKPEQTVAESRSKKRMPSGISISSSIHSSKRMVQIKVCGLGCPIMIIAAAAVVVAIVIAIVIVIACSRVLMCVWKEKERENEYWWL